MDVYVECPDGIVELRCRQLSVRHKGGHWKDGAGDN